MKRIMYKVAGVGALCLALAVKGMAQDGDAAPREERQEEKIVVDTNDNQSEIIIRQKGDKDGKVTIEIRKGDVFVNGKPLDKFEDQNIEVEKRPMSEEGAAWSLAMSPFRRDEWQQRKFERELNQRMGDVNRRMKEINVRMTNQAFLGVSSRRSETGGATVLDITKGSPAEKAGLKKGDVITRLDDKTIETPDNLFDVVHGLKPGDKVKITFKREGKEQTASAVLDKSKSMEKSFNYNYKYRPDMRMYETPELPEIPDMREIPELRERREMPELRELPGMESPLWGPMPPKLGIKAQDAEDGNGASVLDVSSGSAAEKAGLKKGDIITALDGIAVNGADDLIQQVREGRNKINVQVKILRDGKAQELSLKIPRKLKTAEL
jgi:serine protease Do